MAESLKRVAGISIFPVGRGMKRNDFPESDGTKKPPMRCFTVLSLACFIVISIILCFLMPSPKGGGLLILGVILGWLKGTTIFRSSQISNTKNRSINYV